MKKFLNHPFLYWFITIWLAFGMTTSGILQIIQHEAEVEFMTALGYPQYFLPLLGAWKLLGVLAILTKGHLLLKEWAYAGFFFAMSGALYSHLAVGDAFGETFPSALLLVLVVLSWHLRPAKRRLSIKATK